MLDKPLPNGVIFNAYPDSIGLKLSVPSRYRNVPGFTTSFLSSMSLSG